MRCVIKAALIAVALSGLFAAPVDGYVFSQIDGTQIKSFKKGLRALLEAAGARQDIRDAAR